MQSGNRESVIEQRVYGPIWNFEEGEILSGHLREQACNDCVRDCHFVNIAPLQFGKELAQVHGCLSLQSSWKRRSLRSWSKSGSSRSRAGVNGATDGHPSYGISSRRVRAGIARSRSPKRASIRARISSYSGPVRASLDD